MVQHVFCIIHMYCLNLMPVKAAGKCVAVWVDLDGCYADYLPLLGKLHSSPRNFLHFTVSIRGTPLVLKLVIQILAQSSPLKKSVLRH